MGSSPCTAAAPVCDAGGAERTTPWVSAWTSPTSPAASPTQCAAAASGSVHSSSPSSQAEDVEGMPTNSMRNQVALGCDSHLLWWFCSPLGCDVGRRAIVLGDSRNVRPLVFRRCDGRWPSRSTGAFNVFTACDCVRHAIHGGNQKLLCSIVGKEIGFKIQLDAPIAGDENDREVLTRTGL